MTDTSDAYPTEIGPAPWNLTRQELARLYRVLRLTRAFENRLGKLYRQGKMLGAVYLGTGQEAIAAGVASQLQPADVFNTVSRSLAAWFYRGVDPKDVMARWLGKDVPPSHGRELGLFLADLERYGIAPFHNGSMASWIPSGAGFALAFKMKREPRVYVAFTGDGATSPGDFYEGLNLASIHKLPLVVVAENNLYAYSTPIAKQMPVPNIAARAPAFDVYAESAFGNDLFAVMGVAARSLAHARSGRGPALIELHTFRRRGHGEHDDAAYVPAAIRAFWEERDPLRLYARYLTGRGGFTGGELEAIDRECEARVDDAVRYAEELPYPDPASAGKRLYA